MTDSVDAATVNLFRGMVDSYVADRYPFEARFARLSGEGPGYDMAAWRSYAEMGWLAVALDEASGGLDADPAIVGVIMEGVGAGLLLEPVFASAVLSVRLLRLLGWTSAGQIAAREIASGEAILALAHFESVEMSPWDDVGAVIAHGRLTASKIAVLHGDSATHFLVTATNAAGDLEVALVRSDAPGIAREGYRMLDGRRGANLVIDTGDFIPMAGGSRARAAFDQAIDEGIAALCSEALGAIRALNRLTLEYLGARQQFGKPIGANQVLQHRMVENLIQEAEVASVVAVVQTALRSSDVRQRARTVSAAMAVTVAAARHIANDAVQMHGGIGMTHEYAVSHYFKRLRVIELLLGQRRHHLRRFSDHADT